MTSPPRPTLLPLLLPLLLIATAGASPPDLSDFKLEPKQQPRIDPRLQGPGLTPAPVPLPRERPIAQPPPQRPAPSQQAAPASEPTPSKRASRPSERAPTTAPARSTPIAPRADGRSTPRLTEPDRPAATSPVETTSAPDEVGASPVDLAPDTTEGPATSAPSDGEIARPDGRGSVWPMVLFGLAGLVVLLALGVALRRRGRTIAPRPATTPPMPEPEVLTPTVRPQATPAPVAATPASAMPERPANSPAGPLTLAFQPLEGRATALGSSLKARLTVTNTGGAPATGLSLDLIMAGAGEAGDAELTRFADEGSCQPRLDLPDLSPGESHTVERSLRVGARDFRPIQLADRAIFVPLVGVDLRARVGGEVVRLTAAHLVGRTPRAGGKMGPFRVDQGPRHYRELGQRPHALAG